ncbi:hypothetical protein TNCV_781281 [Trichonephila clavipes]|nr:hypothetical protein TNCV_781281 [Trichonephila clavipes]
MAGRQLRCRTLINQNPLLDPVLRGHGSRVVCHEFKPSTLKTRRVGQQCTLNLSRAETSSRWSCVVVRKEVPAQVSSTLLDHGSKSPRLADQCDVNIHSLTRPNPSQLPRVHSPS